MKVHLPYGRSGLDVELPDSADVYLPPRVAPLADPMEAVCRSLSQPTGSPPLRDLLRPGRSVAVVVSDITRPVPNTVILPPVLQTLAEAGVSTKDVTIVVGTGMHRASTADELGAMLGKDTLSSYRVIDHVARDASTLEYVETTRRGCEVWVNRDYLRADVKVLTGFIEPHIFCGYSGGGKAVLPGVCGAKTILQHHSYELLADPQATWCRAHGNPCFDEARTVALTTGPDFLVNVTLNEKKEITGVFSGGLAAAHDAGIAQAAEQALTPVPHLCDIVVVTNMGWPADINLYQAVKGMSAGGEAVKPGGAVVLVAECVEALGNDDFEQLLHSDTLFPRIMERIAVPGFAADEQWGIQCMDRVLSRADVWLHSSMSRETTERAHLRYCADVGETVASLASEFRRELGAEPSIAVFPHGQLTIPHLQP